MTLRARVGMTVGVLGVLGAIAWSSWRLYLMPAGADATELLRSAARSLHHTAVQGTVTTRVRMPEGWREARAEVHRGDGRARVRYLDGPAAGMTIVRQGRGVWATRNDGEPLRCVDLPADPTEALAGLVMHPHLSARVTGGREVAGRPTTLVATHGRFGAVTLGVDRETSFPLLMERHDADGQLRVSTVYESADFTVEPPPAVEPPEGEGRGRRGGERYDSIGELKGKVSFTLYQPAHVPGGFELQGVRLFRAQAVESVGLRFSDGLNWVMVVQRPQGSEQARPEPPRERSRERSGEHRQEGRGRHGMREPRGMMHVPGSPAGDAVRRSLDGTVVLVMGSVPRDELARIADSLKPVP